MRCVDLEYSHTRPDTCSHAPTRDVGQGTTPYLRSPNARRFRQLRNRHGPPAPAQPLCSCGGDGPSTRCNRKYLRERTDKHLVPLDGPALLLVSMCKRSQPVVNLRLELDDATGVDGPLVDHVLVELSGRFRGAKVKKIVVPTHPQRRLDDRTLAWSRGDPAHADGR